MMTIYEVYSTVGGKEERVFFENKHLAARIAKRWFLVGRTDILVFERKFKDEYDLVGWLNSREREPVEVIA